MPDGIEVNLSHKFGRRFSDLQYSYSSSKAEGVYFIRAVPDLVFSRKQQTTAGVVFVYNDTDMVESRLPCSLEV